MSELRWCKACDLAVPHDLIEEIKVDDTWDRSEEAFKWAALSDLGFWFIGMGKPHPPTRTVLRCQRCDAETIPDD